MKLDVDLASAIRLGIRSGSWSLYAWASLGLVAVVVLASFFSARQPATVALDVGLAFVRIALPIVAIILTQELIGREFDRRYFLSSFTYPRPRYIWLLGRYGAIALLTLGLLVPMGALLAAIVGYVGSSYAQGTPVNLGLPYLITLSFVAVDALVVLAFAVLMAVTAVTPGFVLVGAIGFVLITRSYASVIELLRQDGKLVAQLADPETYRTTMSLLNYMLPDLGGLDVRVITLYDKMSLLPGDWAWRVSGALFYAVALLALSAWLLRRREFG
jgi:Cu-processing system permease protein